MKRRDVTNAAAGSESKFENDCRVRGNVQGLHAK
jgi:hypothetical protein